MTRDDFRAEARTLFDAFAARIEAVRSLPVVVRAGDTPNRFIVENFPQPIEREFVITLKRAVPPPPEPTTVQKGGFPRWSKS